MYDVEFYDKIYSLYCELIPTILVCMNMLLFSLYSQMKGNIFVFGAHNKRMSSISKLGFGTFTS